MILVLRGIGYLGIMKLEHIGIAVKDLGLSNELFEKILGKAPYKSENVESEAVTTSFL